MGLRKYTKEIVKWAFDFVMSHYLVGSLILWFVNTSVFGYLIKQITNIKQQDILGSTDWKLLCLVLAFVVIFMVTTYLFFNSLRLSKKYIDLKAMVENVGVLGFYFHKTAAEKKEDWELFRAILNSRPTKNLYILGLTGWHTFGSPKSALYDVLTTFNGQVNILLLDPKSDAFRNRMSELKANENIHKMEIIDTLKSCQLLKKSGVNINVTLYSQKPIWKMMFTDSYMWLQHYSKDNHVDENHVYSFYKNESGTSIFTPLTEVFQKRLRDDGSRTVDLDIDNFEVLIQ